VEPAQLLKRYLEAIPDLDALREMLDENVAFTLYARGGTTNVGRDRILRGLAREFESFYRRDAFRLEVLTVFGDGEFAGARFQITADTARGPYHNNYAILARFTAGKLVEAWEFTDTASARDQLRLKMS
jgi:ketosteroid isomerase-like protein